MSARVLLHAVVHKRAVRKTSKAGKPYLMASARDGNGPDAKWWTVFAFTEAAIETLEVLVEGETFAATGSFDATIWALEGREPRGNLTLTADVVISARKAKQKPKAGKPRGSSDRQSGRSARASASWAAPREGEGPDVGRPF